MQRLQPRPRGSVDCPSVAAPLVIDCDPGVDDAIAILLALASPEVELLALTTVAGNLPLETTTRNALRVLALAGREDVPFAAGAARPLVVRRDRDAALVHGTDGLGGAPAPESSAAVVPMHAVDLLAEILERSDEPVLLAPVGPLTNVALLAALRPELLPSLGRVAIMGGGEGMGNVTPAAEFNIWFDPEAAARAFDWGLDVTMVGLNATRAAMLFDPDVDVIRGAGPIGAVAAAMLDHYLDWQVKLYGYRGVSIHDALAVATLLRPELVTTVEALVTIDTTTGPARGMTLVDRHRWDGQEPNAQVAVGVDRDAFVSFLCERLARLERG
jgi:inosine-uridine nucleoside N-ribohydrolase